MTAGELMRPNCPALAERSTLRQACGLLARSGLPAVPVRGAGGLLLGSITMGGLLSALASDADRSAPVADLMDRFPAAVLTYAHTESILAEMDEAGLWALPVVDGENRLVGLVSLSNLAGVVSAPLLAQAWNNLGEFQNG